MKVVNKFTWGDPILVRKYAPSVYHPGAFASICGIDRIITENEAKKFECNVGDWVYIIEFEDGSDVEIAERYLEKYKMER